MLDFIIVGKGIAGIALACMLEERGHSFAIFEDPQYINASAVSAGLINPVTGRRYALSWNFPELYKIASEFYQRISSKLDLYFFSENDIIRAIHSVRQLNDWSSRETSLQYSEMLEDQELKTQLKGALSPVEGYIRIKSAMQINMPLLKRALALRWEEQGILRLQWFDYERLELNQGFVQYGELLAGKIIFADGANVIKNPFFNYLPVLPNLGEVMIAEIPGLHLPGPVKNDLFFVPLGKEQFWIGSSYTDLMPGQQERALKKDQMLERLNGVLRLPFKMLEYRSAVRPTVKDRRPLVGVHHQNANIAILNGLGTKGASLAPFCAKQLLDHILDCQEINTDINIRRYSPQ